MEDELDDHCTTWWVRQLSRSYVIKDKCDGLDKGMHEQIRERRMGIRYKATLIPLAQSTEWTSITAHACTWERPHTEQRDKSKLVIYEATCSCQGDNPSLACILSQSSILPHLPLPDSRYKWGDVYLRCIKCFIDDTNTHSPLVLSRSHTHFFCFGNTPCFAHKQTYTVLTAVFFLTV